MTSCVIFTPIPFRPHLVNSRHATWHQHLCKVTSYDGSEGQIRVYYHVYGDLLYKILLHLLINRGPIAFFVRAGGTRSCIRVHGSGALASYWKGSWTVVN